MFSVYTICCRAAVCSDSSGGEEREENVIGLFVKKVFAQKAKYTVKYILEKEPPNRNECVSSS